MAHKTSFDITDLVINLLQTLVAMRQWISVAEVVHALQGTDKDFDAMDNKQQRSKVRAVFKKLTHHKQVDTRTGSVNGRATNLVLWHDRDLKCDVVGSDDTTVTIVEDAATKKKVKTSVEMGDWYFDVLTIGGQLAGDK